MALILWRSRESSLTFFKERSEFKFRAFAFLFFTLDHVRGNVLFHFRNFFFSPRASTHTYYTITIVATDQSLAIPYKSSIAIQQ